MSGTVTALPKVPKVTRPFNVRFCSVGLPEVTCIRRKATDIRRTEGRHSQANRDD